MEFTIRCKMKDRWVPYFVSMLKRMEQNGAMGHSELVGIYSDGDGDFRPCFDFNIEVGKVDYEEIEVYGKVYDAG